MIQLQTKLRRRK